MLFNTMTGSRDKQLFNCECLECDHCLRFAFCISVRFSFLFFFPPPPAAPVQQKMVKCIAKSFETVHSALSVRAHSCGKMNKQHYRWVTVGDISTRLGLQSDRGPKVAQIWLFNDCMKVIHAIKSGLGQFPHVVMNLFKSQIF